MKLKKYEIKTYFTKETYQRIFQEATARNTKMSKIIRDSISEYFALREELANAIEAPGNLGEKHNGKIIHTLLARTEERLEITVNKLEKKIADSVDKLQLIITMIDRFYFDLMQFLPKIPKELIGDSIALAKTRHAEWFKDTRKQKKIS